VKIVFVNRYFYPDHSATSQILADLAFELARHPSVGGPAAREGREVCVVTSRQRYEDPNAVLESRESVRGVQIHRIWTTRFGRAGLMGRSFDYLSFYFGAFIRLCALLKPGDIVVAKTDPPLISVVAMMAAKLRGALLVNWLQDLFPEAAMALNTAGIRGPLAFFLKKARNVSLKKARFNVAIGEKMSEKIIREGIPIRQVRVIPNWSDGAELRPLKREENKLKAEWGLENRFVVGYSGNMGRAHEFETVLRAAEILKDENIIFLFIGGGKKLEEIQTECKKRGLKNFVFKPYQPYLALNESLNAAELHLVTLQPDLEGFVVPSKFYGVAAAGKPTLFIGDLEGEIPKILKKVSCGYAFAIGDAQGLAACVRQLAKNPDLLNALGLNARAVFEERFDRQKAFRAWKEVLMECGKMDTLPGYP